MSLQNLFVRTQFSSDFDGTWYGWREGRGYKVTDQIIEYLHELC